MFLAKIWLLHYNFKENICNKSHIFKSYIKVNIELLRSMYIKLYVSFFFCPALLQHKKRKNNEKVFFKGIIYILFVYNKIEIYERRGRDLSENIYKSIWCELKFPPKKIWKGGYFQVIWNKFSFGSKNWAIYTCLVSKWPSGQGIIIERHYLPKNWLFATGGCKIWKIGNKIIFDSEKRSM